MKTKCLAVQVCRDQPNSKDLNERLFANILDTKRYVELKRTDITENNIEEVK